METQFHPFDIVSELEKRIAEYAGSKYAVATDSCTNALMLSLEYRFNTGNYSKIVELPCQTYVGVPYAVLNAGGKCVFREYLWEGCYSLGETGVIDSARRFTKHMYIPGTLFCLSAHWGKHLKIGRGGFILTDDKDAYNTLKVMRFDGRTEKVSPANDTFNMYGHHCFMIPEEAARGLMLMYYMPEYNDNLKWDGYPDLSKFEIFQNFKKGNL